ncbi:penicillin-binding protein activator [Paracoccaceae bacterium GXU_MW_L88]
MTMTLPFAKILKNGAAAVALAGLAACAAVPTARHDFGPLTGAEIERGETVTVAMLLPQTAPNPEVQGLARDMQAAANMAMADLNGATLELKFYDTAGNADTASSVATQAISDGAKLIVGPLYAENANAAGIAANAANVNVLAFSNASAIAEQNVFVMGNTLENVADRVVSFAKGRGINNIGVVYPSNFEGELGRAAVETAVIKNGVTLAGAGTYEFSPEGVTTAAPQIVSILKDKGAEQVVFSDNPEQSLTYIASALSENGLNPAEVKYSGLTKWDGAGNALSAPALQGGWFTLADPTITAAFNSRFRDQYGRNPHPLAALAYDGVAAAGALIGTGRSDALTSKGLTRPGGFVGANGPFRFNANRIAERALAVMEVRDGAAVMLDPAPRQFGGGGLF